MNSNWDKYDLAYVDPNEDYYNGTLFNAYCCAASDIPDWTTSATKVSTCSSTPTIEIAGGNVIRAVDGGTIEIAAPGLTISGDEVATKLDIDCKIEDLKTMIADKSSCFEANDNYILDEINKLRIGLADLREELKAQQTYEVIHGFKKLF